MSGDKRTRLKNWLESGEAKLHPLNFPQRELWEASPVPVGDPANHICCLISVRGLITPLNCETAVQRVVERQEALRFSFLPGKEQPLQMVRKSGEPNLQFRDLLSGETDPGAVEELAQEIFHAPFDLLLGPLHRAVILRRAADDHVIVFAIHHAIADGWTLGVFIQDLFAAYLQAIMGRSEPLPPVPLSYTAWSAMERAFWQPAELESRATFWKSELAGTRRLWTPSVTPAALQRRVSELPSDVALAARELARLHGATLFSTLFAVFQVALSKWTGAEDIVFGTPVANRGRPAVAETMGYCSGVVPLRARVDRSIQFAAHLRAVQQSTVDSFAHAMPFVELARAVGENPAPGYHPVFQVRFALQNHPIPDVTLPTLSAKLRMRSTGTARFDLGCEITEDGNALEVVWLSRDEMFSASDIADLDRLFVSVLTAACRTPEGRVGALIP